MTKAQEAAAERADALERLRELCPPGTVVHCSLEHVSASGMTRWIKLYVVHDNQLRHITYDASQVTGWRRTRGRDGLQVDGCGMDMGFHTVYTLAYYLHGDGYALTSRWM